METDRYLSSANAPDIVEDLRLCVDSGARRMIVNCAPLKYATAAGLRAFLDVARHMYDAGGTVLIKGLQGQPREIFFASGMDAIIPLVKEETRFPAYRN